MRINRLLNFSWNRIAEWHIDYQPWYTNYRSDAKTETDRLRIFLGISLGFYLGKASRSGISPALSFVLGVIVSLTSIVIYGAKFSPQTWVLVMGFITVFLAYNSGLLRENTELEQWTERLKITSWFGIIAVLLIQYGVPILVAFVDWLNEQLIIISRVSESWATGKLALFISLLIIFAIIGLMIHHHDYKGGRSDT